MKDGKNHPGMAWTQVWQTSSHGNTGPASYNVINIAREEVHMQNAWIIEKNDALKFPQTKR
jgi:hypothetical protein